MFHVLNIFLCLA